MLPQYYPIQSDQYQNIGNQYNHCSCILAICMCGIHIAMTTIIVICTAVLPVKSKWWIQHIEEWWSFINSKCVQSTQSPWYNHLYHHKEISYNCCCPRSKYYKEYIIEKSVSNFHIPYQNEPVKYSKVLQWIIDWYWFYKV